MQLQKVFGRLVGALALTIAAVGCSTFNGEVPVELDVPETVYISPANGDGIQDEFRVPLEIPAVANLLVQGYRFVVLDAEGTAVYVETAEVPERPKRASIEIPEALVWGGVTTEGEYVADGEYSYTVEAWDRRGNSGQTRLRYVVVDNTPPAVEVYTSFPLFSPNNDGRLDQLPIRQSNSSFEDEWTGQVLNAQGQVVREYTWEGWATDFSWDGKDIAGAVASDGIYSYQVTSIDLAGNTGTSGLAGLTIDTEPTTVTLDLGRNAFSPNGDGVHDVMVFAPRLSVTRNIESWVLEIYNSLGQLRYSIPGVTPVPESISFDGKVQAGSLLPDGNYRGVLTVEYRNGDSSQAPSPLFALDTVRPFGTTSAPYTVFSPDGDGRKDTIEIRQSSSTEQLWQGNVVDSTGHTVRSFSWEGRAALVWWDGKNSAGAVVADGTYVYELSSTDNAGNSTAVSMTGIVIDTRPTPVSVAPALRSFSPNGDGIVDTVGFDVTAALADSVLLWRLDVLAASGTAVRTMSGSGRVPQRITWDGKDSSGRVTEGRYTARATIEYLKGNIATATSGADVTVDISAPVVRVSSAPTPFSPDNDGVADMVTISLAVTDATAVQDWSAVISDPANNRFKTFSGTGAVPRQLTWNGLSDDGELVQSAEDYVIAVTVRDAVWNTGTVSHTIPIDILVIREGDRLRIVISSIYFKPFTADYRDIAAEDAARNLRTLDRLAEILKKYNQYQIRLEGHAVRVYWNDSTRLEREEREVLLPLSTERAAVIRQALIERGIAATRMTTEGFGGTRPVVPHSDTENRWKNRRVEFLLIRAN
jgi:outer membrane protein OmpA-like peptidoglycan-associated protein/flagellar hook assembly protein FlgD